MKKSSIDIESKIRLTAALQSLRRSIDRDLQSIKRDNSDGIIMKDDAFELSVLENELDLLGHLISVIHPHCTGV